MFIEGFGNLSVCCRLKNCEFQDFSSPDCSGAALDQDRRLHKGILTLLF